MRGRGDVAAAYGLAEHTRGTVQMAGGLVEGFRGGGGHNGVPFKIVEAAHGIG